MEFGGPRPGLRWVSGFEMYSFDTVEGWSVLIHPDTGEWIISGRRRDTPLTVKEKKELKDALRKALLKAYPKKVWEKEEFDQRLDAEVEHRPKMGETPVLLSDDVVEQIPADLRGGVRVRYREREVFYRVRGGKAEVGGAGVGELAAGVVGGARLEWCVGGAGRGCVSAGSAGTAGVSAV